MFLVKIADPAQNLPEASEDESRSYDRFGLSSCSASTSGRRLADSAFNTCSRANNSLRAERTSFETLEASDRVSGMCA
jgi:hypothetical protein